MNIKNLYTSIILDSEFFNLYKDEFSARLDFPDIKLRFSYEFMAINVTFSSSFVFLPKLFITFQQTYPQENKYIMKKIYCLVVILSISHASAKTTTIFECKTTNHKIVSVTMDHNKIYYNFGKQQSTPELFFSIPKSKASTYQWMGAGRSIYYTVNVPNGHITYTLYSSMDRLTEDHKTESGIIVQKANKEIARILCDENNKFYTNNIEGIDLPSEE